jgi:hypothetical protein
LRSVRRFFTGYFAIVGILVHLAPIGAVIWALKYYRVTPRQLVVKALDRADIEAPWLIRLISPAPRYADVPFDGRMRAAHPRILLPQLAQWNGRGVSPYFSKRLNLYRELGMNKPGPRAYCAAKDGLVLATCWIMTGDYQAGARAVAKLRAAKSVVGNYTDPANIRGFGSPWRFALAFDLLYNNPSFTARDKASVKSELRRTMIRLLDRLDDDDLSLWHGRATIAGEAWLIALALGADTDEDARLATRAQGHFLSIADALRVSEGWPGGYNYWINNRALIFALAASGYINGLEKTSRAADILRTARRTGRWNIYATRPDNRFEGLGDEGPRIDLKDETRRAIDVLAQLTRDGALASYSRYLGNLHGSESYYRGYRWSFPLFNDPTVIPAAPILGRELSPLGRVLPGSALFGRGALNLAYIRSGWAANSTFISFRAGASMTHHGHYDAGHFTIFKGAPLAINSSVYGAYFGENRLNYSIRTIAKNSLLILRPGEKVQPNRFFSPNVSDGGQRLTLPTGSAITSVENWADNRSRGLYLNGGVIRDFQFRAGVHSFISSDITQAYNNTKFDAGGKGGKVSSVVRELLYLNQDDVLIIHDEVVSTKAGYTKKWLLHSVNKPEVADAVVLKGARNNGILHSEASSAIIRNGNGSLMVQRFAPSNAVIRLVGGPDYQYYVEEDGDDSTLDGRNMIGGANPKPWFDNGLWRMEIQPREPSLRDEFLIALSPSIGPPRRNVVRRLKLVTGTARGLVTDNSVIVFADEPKRGEISFVLPGSQSRIYLVGTSPGMRLTLTSAGSPPKPLVAKQRMTVIETASPPGTRITLVLGRPGPR